MTETRRWRIDELAHTTGLTVDTIRYYQREGLLPPGAREGRHRIYGPEHVHRIKRIKELQARRFSIAAIRALVDSIGDGLRGVLADDREDVRLTFDELLERSGASAELAAELQAAGTLRDPHEFGRTAYDGDDLEMLRGMAAVEASGVSPRAVGVLARIYADGIEATQRRILDLFEHGVDDDPELDVTRFEEMADRDPGQLLPSMRQLVDYTHHRTIQRLTLELLERGAITQHVDADASDELEIVPRPERRADR
jgi:DNA-binding transcriptional MerR regulator